MPNLNFSLLLLLCFAPTLAHANSSNLHHNLDNLTVPLALAGSIIIKSLAVRGIGILITDHNVRETLNVCERAYIFNEGEVIAKGTPEEILADKTVLNVYLGRDFRL